MVFLLLISKLTLGCFSLSSRLFHYLNASVSCCVCVVVLFFLPSFIFFLCFLYVRVFDLDVHLICIFKLFNVNSVSSLDEPFRLLEQML